MKGIFAMTNFWLTVLAVITAKLLWGTIVAPVLEWIYIAFTSDREEKEVSKVRGKRKPTIGFKMKCEMESEHSLETSEKERVR